MVRVGARSGFDAVLMLAQKLCQQVVQRAQPVNPYCTISPRCGAAVAHSLWERGAVSSILTISIFGT